MAAGRARPCYVPRSNHIYSPSKSRAVFAALRAAEARTPRGPRMRLRTMRTACTQHRKPGMRSFLPRPLTSMQSAQPPRTLARLHCMRPPCMRPAGSMRTLPRRFSLFAATLQPPLPPARFWPHAPMPNSLSSARRLSHYLIPTPCKSPLPVAFPDALRRGLWRAAGPLRARAQRPFVYVSKRLHRW